MQRTVHKLNLVLTWPSFSTEAVNAVTIRFGRRCAVYKSEAPRMGPRGIRVKCQHIKSRLMEPRQSAGVCHAKVGGPGYAFI
jgi:hypothetical protein